MPNIPCRCAKHFTICFPMKTKSDITTLEWKSVVQIAQISGCFCCGCRSNKQHRRHRSKNDCPRDKPINTVSPGQQVVDRGLCIRLHCTSEAQFIFLFRRVFAELFSILSRLYCLQSIYDGRIDSRLDANVTDIWSTSPVCSPEVNYSVHWQKLSGLFG